MLINQYYLSKKSTHIKVRCYTFDMLEKDANDQKRNLLPKKNAEVNVPEPLSTQELVEIVSEAYLLVGPRNGSALVEANIILTLSGTRGHTEFFIDDPTKTDSADVDKLKELFARKGIIIDAIGPFMSPRGEILMVGMVSLRGIERVSKLTKIPGFIPFQASQGWEGYIEWSNKCLENLEALESSKSAPLSADELETLTVGVAKGYPDIAIHDFIDWLRANREKLLAESRIPYVNLYGGAEPNFSFFPQHRNNPTIRQTILTWKNVLEKFYTSSWHEEIKHDEQFLQARAAKNLKQAQFLRKINLQT